MARNWFGGTHLDLVFSTWRFSSKRRVVTIKPYAVLTFWDSGSGGTRYTDLLLNGVPVNAITTDGDGYYPEFQGPDGVESMWVDDGDGVRHLIYTSQARATSVDTVLTAPASGTYTLDPAVATYYSLNLTGDTTLAVANFEEGASVTVELVQDATGGRVVTLPESWLGEAETTLTATANTVERLVIWVAAGRTNVQRATSGPFALPWSPDLLTDQVAWFDASTVPGDAGDPIGSWVNRWAERDLGISNGASQPTLQLVNGVEVVRFDGADDRLVTVDGVGAAAGWSGGIKAQPGTVALLVKVAAASTSTQTVMGSGSGTNEWLLGVMGSGSGSTWRFNAGAEMPAGPGDDNTWTTVVVVVNGAGSKVRIDGVEATGNAGTEGLDGLRLANNSSLGTVAGMDVHEVVIVNHAAGVGEVADIEAYLNAKRDTLNGV